MSLDFRLAELERRLENLLRLGTVAELDDAAARVRVQSGNLLTAWLPWLTRRAGEDRDWWAPEPGEQVLILSPSGDLAQGVVLPALYRAGYSAPSDSREKRRTEIADGAFVEYDRASGRLQINVVGNAEITVGGKTTLVSDGTVEIDGGSGQINGAVQGDCLCAFTGKPHPHISSTVTESF